MPDAKVAEAYAEAAANFFAFIISAISHERAENVDNVAQKPTSTSG